MRYSVIVPFRNEEQHITQCLEALCRQSVPRHEYELIFVDNGSTDGSSERVQQIPGVRLFTERAVGAYAARNRGLLAARGDLIVFTDADCAPAADWLERFWDGMERAGADIALGRRRFPTGRAALLALCEEYEDAKTAYVVGPGPSERLFAFTNNVAIRRAVVQRLGPFLEWSRGADIEYLQRYVRRFGRDAIIHVPGAIVTHLELDRVHHWLTKQFLYGGVTRQLKQEGVYRPLTYQERRMIQRRCECALRYSPIRRLGFCGILALGGLCFELGTLWGEWSGCWASQRLSVQ